MKTILKAIFLLPLIFFSCTDELPDEENPTGEEKPPGEETPPPTSENGVIDIDLKASRLSGPAPLAVQFDAIGTTHDDSELDTFRELGYHFTFGDAASGTWKHNNKPKNSQVGGPIAAHVFESPGTYLVQVRAQDADGNYSDESVQITVTDPNTVYEGTKTVVISTNNNTAGAPAGAELLTNQSEWPAWESGKRYLLMSGQDFTSFGDLRIFRTQDIQIGKNGSGSDPIVKQIDVDRGSAPATNWSKRVVFSDLNAENGRVTIPNSSEDIYIIRGTNIGISVGSSVKGWVSDKATQEQMDNLIWPENIFMYESTSVNAWILSKGFNILGSEMLNPREHNIRTAYIVRAVIAHNLLYNAARTKHNIKIHSEGLFEKEDEPLVKNSLGGASRWIVVADNVLGNGAAQPNGWSITVKPENNIKGQGVQDAIVENNNFLSDFNVQVILGGRRLTERGNTTSIGEYKVLVSNGIGGIPATWDGPQYVDDSQILPDAPGS